MEGNGRGARNVNFTPDGNHRDVNDAERHKTIFRACYHCLPAIPLHILLRFDFSSFVDSCNVTRIGGIPYGKCVRALVRPLLIFFQLYLGPNVED